MYFRELHQRLIDVARERVRAGEFTVRGLARIAGMSQPHMQNALKGIRSLSPDAADRLMRALSLSIPDPNWLDSGLSAPTIGVPLLRSRIGPGIDTDFSVFRGHVDFDSALVGDLVNPLAVRLAAERGRGGEIYFVTDGQPVVFRDFLTRLAATQGVVAPAREAPMWVAKFAATGCEFLWRTFSLAGAPPISRTVVNLMFEEVTVNDRKARDELGYTGHVSIEQGLAELAADHAVSVS